MAEEADVFDAIKAESQTHERAQRDSGDVNMPWEALDKVLQQPDGRPAPHRIRSISNPEKAMGVILQLDSKQQTTGAMWEADPEAENRKKRIKARKMQVFGEKEVDQIIQNKMQGDKGTQIHLYLSTGITDSYQLGGQAFGKAVVILAPRYMAWEKGKHAWILGSLEGESGWAIGGRSSYDNYVTKFIDHVMKT